MGITKEFQDMAQDMAYSIYTEGETQMPPTNRITSIVQKFTYEFELNDEKIQELKVRAQTAKNQGMEYITWIQILENHLNEAVKQATDRSRRTKVEYEK